MEPKHREGTASLTRVTCCIERPINQAASSASGAVKPLGTDESEDNVCERG